MSDQEVGFRAYYYRCITLECVLLPAVQSTVEPSETGEELSETDGESEETDEDSAEKKKKSGSTVLNTHAPASMAYWIQSTDPRFYRPPQMFVGASCVERCLDVLQRDVDYLLWVLRWGILFRMSISVDVLYIYADLIFIKVVFL